MGGVKGIAYVGALEELDNKGILDNIECIGGASAGAITALLLGLGYTGDELEQILSKMDFKSFLDDSAGLLRDTLRLVEDYGWYKGDSFRSWIADKIEAKTGNTESTFRDIHEMSETKGFREIYFIGTNLSTRFSEVFSYENSPDMVVADAVRISMSIPLFFKAVREKNDDIYVDGGVLSNYPIKLFDKASYVKDNGKETEYYKKQNKILQDYKSSAQKYIYNCETLGFRLDTAEEISMFHDHTPPPHHKIDNFGSYVISLADTLYDSQLNSHLHSDDWQRTVYIDSIGVKTTDFNLSDETKKKLIESGREYTKKYFEWYDNSKEAPFNKIG